jgi:hypothetical protein
MQPINLQLLVLNKRATQAYFPFDHAMLPCSLVQACSCSALHFVLWHCITFVVLAIPDGRYALLVPIFVCIQKDGLDSKCVDYGRRDSITRVSRPNVSVGADPSVSGTNKSRDHEIVPAAARTRS